MKSKSAFSKCLFVNIFNVVKRSKMFRFFIQLCINTKLYVLFNPYCYNCTNYLLNKYNINAAQFV